MNPLLETFLAESRELLQHATDDLLALERSPRGAGAGERLESVFRDFHTLKGSSALFPFRPMTAALHAAEDLLAGLREDEVADEAAAIDVALECLDRLARWLDAIEAADGTFPAGAEQEAATLEAALRRALAQPSEAVAAAASAGSGADWLGTVTEEERVALRAVPHAADEVPLAITYDPDPGCFLRGEDPLGMLRRLPGLALLRVSPRDPWPDPQALDPFTCNLRLRAIVFGDRQAIEQALRVLGGQARVAALPSAILGQDRATDRHAADALLAAILDEQLRLLRTAAPAREQAGRIGSALKVAANALLHAGDRNAARLVEAATVELVATGQAEAAAAVIERARRRREPTEAPEASAPMAPERTATPRTLRVDPARVDRLIGLADEMVLEKNALLDLLRRAEGEGALRPELLQSMRARGAAVERLTRAWYDAAAQLRLLPFEQVFRRFPRVVRELARELGKPAELRLSGGETEADRDIVDRLAEPLLHLLRNSLDHGIEPTEQRRRAGKPETAVITLHAAAEADRILVEITDDGRGLNPALLRRRAVERGDLAADAAAALSDEEALQLVFAAGFSTAEAVSELSGRGVGMDVVRSTAEGLGGSVQIRSRLGEGTAIRLVLPLSVTLTSILTVGVGGHAFGLPLQSVSRSLRVARRHLRAVGAEGDAAFAIEGRLVPLVPLRSLLGLPDAAPAAGEDGEARIVLVRSDDQEAGLEVEEVGDRLEVVLRPLGGLLAGTEGYLGTTLLGSGQVLLVLDPHWMLR